MQLKLLGGPFRDALFSKWGDDDQQGNMNYLVPGKVLESLAIPRKGRLYSLSHKLDDQIPINPFQGRLFLQSFRRLSMGPGFGMPALVP